MPDDLLTEFDKVGHRPRLDYTFTDYGKAQAREKRASVQEKFDELRKELNDLEKGHSLSADEPSVKTENK